MKIHLPITPPKRRKEVVTIYKNQKDQTEESTIRAASFTKFRKISKHLRKSEKIKLRERTAKISSL